jgi:hypothetical protein
MPVAGCTCDRNVWLGTGLLATTMVVLLKRSCGEFNSRASQGTGHKQPESQKNPVNPVYFSWTRMGLPAGSGRSGPPGSAFPGFIERPRTHRASPSIEEEILELR